MPCIVCKATDAPYRCVDCADEICREHAVACSACRKPLCPEHIQQTPGGRYLCNSCMAARNERHRQRRMAQEAAAAKQAAAPAQPQGGGFSFQDLMSDLPPVPQPSAAAQDLSDIEGGMGISLTQGQRPPRDFDDPRDERNAGAMGLDEVPDADIERKLAQMLGEDEKAVRVLNASAPRSRPMWMGSTLLGVLTWLTFIFVPRPLEPRPYIVGIIALGAVVWAISGLRNEKDSPSERKLNVIGLLLAVAAAGLAFLQRK